MKQYNQQTSSPQKNESVQRTKERFHYQQIGTPRPKRSRSIATSRIRTLIWTSRRTRTHRRDPASRSDLCLASAAAGVRSEREEDMFAENARHQCAMANVSGKTPTSVTCVFRKQKRPQSLQLQEKPADTEFVQQGMTTIFA